MKIKTEKMHSTDILIVGGGLAGIKAAYECCESGLNITLVVKDKLCSGSSFYPLMDMLACQCPLDNEEDKEYLFNEIEESSYGMNNPSMCRIYIDKIRDRVLELPKLGMEYKKFNVSPVACFAKRPRDVFNWENWKLIRKNTYNIFQKRSNFKLLENTDVVHILKKGDKVTGAMCVDEDDDLMVISTKAIILASGGYGDLYKHCLNTRDVSGDGHVLALHAGAELINLEFIQFVPGIIKPLYKVLFNQAMLAHCESITNHNNEDILNKYLPDTLSFKQCMDERTKHGPFTSASIAKHFDIAMMKEILSTRKEDGFMLKYGKALLNDKREMIRNYVKWLKEQKGVDIYNEKIFIAPFYHASNGGVLIDEHCSTSVAGLFAAGEVAGGIHGADRLGGIATGSCFVFGKIAADNAVKYAQSNVRERINSDEAIQCFIDQFDSGCKSTVKVNDIISKIKEIMWFYGNVVRKESDLKLGIKTVAELQGQYNPMFHIESKSKIKAAVKAAHFLELSSILLNTMLLRKESRGSHFRDDYNEMDDTHFKKRLVVCKKPNEDISYKFE